MFRPDKLTHIKFKVIIVQKLCKTNIVTKKYPKIAQNSPKVFQKWRQNT